MNEVPETALLPLDRDNALFVHVMADKHYGGDTVMALNALIGFVRESLTPPQDPWGPLESMMRAGGDGTPHT